jgi:hypothetical protein
MLVDIMMCVCVHGHRCVNFVDTASFLDNLEIRDIKYKQETGQLFLYEDKWFLRRIHQGFRHICNKKPPIFVLFLSF